MDALHALLAATADLNFCSWGLLADRFVLAKFGELMSTLPQQQSLPLP